MYQFVLFFLSHYTDKHVVNIDDYSPTWYEVPWYRFIVVFNTVFEVVLCVLCLCMVQLCTAFLILVVPQYLGTSKFTSTGENLNRVYARRFTGFS
eukprot:SAG11_NODE_7422_length_1147_cov_0.814885_2_plen_95_part_00